MFFQPCQIKLQNVPFSVIIGNYLIFTWSQSYGIGGAATAVVSFNGAGFAAYKGNIPVTA